MMKNHLKCNETSETDQLTPQCFLTLQFNQVQITPSYCNNSISLNLISLFTYFDYIL